MRLKLVAYYRNVTTGHEGTGLDLDAQHSVVEAYAQAVKGTIRASFTEIEAEKLASRPALADAIASAKRNKAKLVIARLDDLARNVAVLSALSHADCDFVAVDNPNANPETVDILCAAAEDQSRRNSTRIKAALARAKSRGVLLGSSRPGHWEGREKARLSGLIKGRKAAAKARRDNAISAMTEVTPIIEKLRIKGESLARIAAHLNETGKRTRRGKNWTAMAVKRILDRQKQKD